MAAKFFDIALVERWDLQPLSVILSSLVMK